MRLVDRARKREGVLKDRAGHRERRKEVECGRPKENSFGDKSAGYAWFLFGRLKAVRLMV